MCGVAERYYGVKFHLSGDPLPRAGLRVLLVSNHRTRVDWLFLWPLAMLGGNAANLRIILKAGLKHVPFFGWALQQFDCCFLERKLDVDEAHMKAMMKQYAGTGSPYMMLLFPEGTDLSESNMRVSDAFAEKNNLPKLKYTLHPRTKGFWICLDALRGSIDEVWDVALGYEGRIAQNEAAMLAAKTSSGAHVYLRRYKVADIPVGDEAASAAWLQARFAEKEAVLERFYSEGKFPGGVRSPVSALKCALSIALFQCMFVALCMLLWQHTLVTGAALLAYFAFFAYTKKTHGGFDKLLLKLSQARHP